MKFVVSVVSPKNFTKVSNYLSTVNKLTNCEPITILVGLTEDQQQLIASSYPNVTFRALPMPPIDTHFKMAYGAYLDVIPECRDDDLIVYVDPTDCTVQTDISPEVWREVTRLSGKKYIYNEFYHQINKIPNLAEVATRNKLSNWMDLYTLQAIKYNYFKFVAIRKSVLAKIRHCFESMYPNAFALSRSEECHNIVLSLAVKLCGFKLRNNVACGWYNLHCPKYTSSPYTVVNGTVGYYGQPVIFAIPLPVLKAQKPKVLSVPTVSVAPQASSPTFAITRDYATTDNWGTSGTIDSTAPSFNCPCDECRARREAMSAYIPLQRSIRELAGAIASTQPAVLTNVQF